MAAAVGNSVFVCPDRDFYKVKEAAWEAAMTEWQGTWDNAEEGRLTHEFFPDVRERVGCKWFEADTWTTQLLSGQGDLNAKLHFFKRTRIPNCACGEVEDAEHIILNYPLYTQQRLGLAGEYGHLDWPPDSLRKLVQDQNTYKALKKFAREVLEKKRVEALVVRSLWRDPEVRHVAELIPNRLYFAVYKSGSYKSKESSKSVHFFDPAELSLNYSGFFADFGPYNLGELYKYCVALDSKLLTHSTVVTYTSGDFMARSNAAYLVGGFALMLLRFDPDKVWARLSTNQFKYAPFRDASISSSSGYPLHSLSIVDCLRGLRKALHFGFVDFSDFELSHYEYFQVEGYSDLNWIIPDRLVALSNPSEDRHSPVQIDKLVNYFTKNNIGTIIRLNYPSYSPSRFTLHGIRHVELYFEDGSTPPWNILQTFLSIMEETNSAVAVHCKAGLGRTGCLIGAYLMKHYRLRSVEAIGWMRICRPAMVVAGQQDWLAKMEQFLWSTGDLWRIRNFRSKSAFEFHKRGVYSSSMKFSGGKGKRLSVLRSCDYLVAVKERNQRQMSS